MEQSRIKGSIGHAGLGRSKLDQENRVGIHTGILCTDEHAQGTSCTYCEQSLRGQ